MGQALRTGHVDLLVGIYSAALSDLEIVDLAQEQLFFAAHKSFAWFPLPAVPSTASAPLAPSARSAWTACPSSPHRPATTFTAVSESIILANHIHPSRTISVSNLYTGFKLAAEGLGRPASGRFFSAVWGRQGFPGGIHGLLRSGKYAANPQMRDCLQSGQHQKEADSGRHPGNPKPGASALRFGPALRRLRNFINLQHLSHTVQLLPNLFHLVRQIPARSRRTASVCPRIPSAISWYSRRRPAECTSLFGSSSSTSS